MRRPVYALALCSCSLGNADVLDGLAATATTVSGSGTDSEGSITRAETSSSTSGVAPPPGSSSTGSLGSETQAADSDTTNAAESSGDGLTSTGPAIGPPVFGAFGEAEVIVELGVANAFDQDPTLTGDRLEIVFSSTRNGGRGSQDLWFSSRESVDDPWDPPQPLESFNDAARQSQPSLTADGLVLTFGSATGNVESNQDLYIATRDDRASPWSAATPMAELNTDQADSAAVLSTDLLSVVYCSGQFTRGWDLFRADRVHRDDTFGPPSRIGWASSDEGDCGPWLSADQNTLLFTSKRAGGPGGFDIYEGTMSEQSVVLLSELSTDADEFHPWLSPDGTIIYFTRAVGEANFDILRATRPRL